MLDVLAKLDVTSDMRCSVATALLSMKWADQDCTILLNTLGQHCESGSRPVAKMRRTGQSYQAIVQYLTPADWAVLTAANPGNAKLSTILQACFGLGLRTPTEPCIKHIASLWIFVNLSEDEIRRLSPCGKSSLRDHVKQEFHRRVKALPECAQHLSTLPDRPLELLDKHPLVYRSHFKDQAPIEPPIDVTALDALDRTYSCRNGGAASAIVKTPKASAPVPTLSVGSPPVEMSAVERIAGMFMDRIGDIQHMQQHMLTMFVEGNHLPSGTLQSLSLASGGQRSLNLRRLPTTSLGQAALPLAPPAVELPDSPKDPIATSSPLGKSNSVESEVGSVSPAGSPSDAKRAESEAESSSPVVPKEASVDDGAVLLDALLEREAEKRKDASKARAEAKAAAKAKALSEEKQAESAPRTAVLKRPAAAMSAKSCSALLNIPVTILFHCHRCRCRSCRRCRCGRFKMCLNICCIWLV
jgi:hypothetical protein